MKELGRKDIGPAAASFTYTTPLPSDSLPSLFPPQGSRRPGSVAFSAHPFAVGPSICARWLPGRFRSSLDYCGRVCCLTSKRNVNGKLEAQRWLSWILVRGLIRLSGQESSIFPWPPYDEDAGSSSGTLHLPIWVTP